MPITSLVKDDLLNGINFLSGSAGTYNEVATFATLPAAIDNAGVMYYVTTTTGIPLINRKLAGHYRSDGANWVYGGDLDITADEVGYDNSLSGLTAADVQDAIDEIIALGHPITSVNAETGIVVLDTDDIAEGTTNLYYTEARVDANLSVAANTAKVSADGSVTTHSDVSNAGSGLIITSTERTTLNSATQPLDNVSTLTNDVGYLNETSHDLLPSDNPHSVSFTQVVASDAGTDITTVEAETLTDGSNADLLHVHTSTAITDFNTAASAAAPVQSVAGKTGIVALAIDDLTDVDTATNTPVLNDRLRWDATNWVPYTPIFAYSERLIPLANESISPATFDTLTFTAPAAGLYKIQWTYTWSLNATNNNFISDITVDTTSVNQVIQEPTNSGGAGIIVDVVGGGTVNSGTSQRYTASGHIIVNLAIGSHDIDLDWQGSVATSEPTIYRSTLSVERFGD